MSERTIQCSECEAEIPVGDYETHLAEVHHWPDAEELAALDSPKENDNAKD